MSDNLPISEQIIQRLKTKNMRFFSCDNIYDVLEDGDKELLIDELTDKFSAVLRSLIIDTDNDPNAMGTARRMAKMYINELFEGRYIKPPTVTSFPNEGAEAYKGMLVVSAEVKSMCSHHHQPVTGTCYIGIIPSHKVIGLSKYARVVWHEARRGTLQEELTQQILKRIKELTMSDNVAVFIEARHGCCENRGIRSHNSTTQTCSISGMFYDASVKDEFFKQIQMQSPRAVLRESNND
jgi:GTP cyclohydrolase I